MKKGWFGGTSSVCTTSIDKNNEGDDGNGGGGSIEKTSLWSTFYEVVDDASQISKAHTAFSESLLHQIIEPLQASLKEMEITKQAINSTIDNYIKDINDGQSNVRKYKALYEQTSKNCIDARTTVDRLIKTNSSNAKELEKARVKAQIAQEKFNASKQSYRQAEDHLKQLQTKLYGQEFPALRQRLRQLESQRCRDALSYMIGITELEKRCASMNQSYAEEMMVKLKKIDLSKDEQTFSSIYLQNTPSVIPSAPSLSAIVDHHLPAYTPPLEITEAMMDHPSMPPAYDNSSNNNNATRTTTGSALCLNA